ncbi:3',5'-cyclic adenosine monophosphate phosphodiesterase CpdA [Lentzea sp. NBRC 105346]|uniref:metallophosphoesterase n=1 Tax=Lentzea sp. NBRC 105346 TaxID=3032205 RepID=UPI0024A02520|nr:metallophosphoesterase [Lentzea sp. NBRC 105346]GLZ33787.1 3',5'-cyclic adenosine monophosphate phosphodiesterase CpdA [Lentzea sp. NBRC 105346]
MIVLAHLSDTHIDGGQRNTDRAVRTMAYVNSLPVDAVLVTGDIADHGTPEEYLEVAKILSSPHPVLTCPGNHDVRGPYREFLLGSSPSDEPINQAHSVGGVTIAMCDSSIPGRDDGLLDDETIAWLDGVLDPEVPTLIAFHHPAAPLHIPLVDNIMLNETDRLADFVSRYPKVAGVLCGHAHTPAATTFAGRPMLVAPGVINTVLLPWEQGEFVDWDAPPAVAFHVLDDDLRLTTHYRFVP